MSILAIAILTYNSEKTIGRLLNSILSQGCSKTKIYVFDDCSTDCTTALVQGVIDGGNKIELLASDKNLGLDKNFIRAFSQVVEEYIWVIGHDDYIEDGALVEIYSILTTTPKISGIFLNYSVFDSARNQMLCKQWIADTGTLKFERAIDFWCKVGVAPSFISSMVRQRALFKATDVSLDIGKNWVDFLHLIDDLRSNIGYIGKPFVVNAGSSESRDWNIDGRAIRALSDLKGGIDRRRCHFPDISYNAIMQSIRHYALKKTVSARMLGLQLNSESSKMLRDIFVGCKLQYLLSVMVLSLPVKSLRYLYHIYNQRFIKRFFWSKLIG